MGFYIISLVLSLLSSNNLQSQIDSLPLLKPDSIVSIKVLFGTDSSVMFINKHYYTVSSKDTHEIMQKIYGIIKEENIKIK